MPDIHDLLATGAGAPLAPLDLDRAVRRGAQRARNRRIAQAAAGSSLAVIGIAAAVVLAGGSSDSHSLQPAQPTQLLPDDSVPEPAGSVDPRLQPVPAADASMLPDGTNFVLVKQVLADRSVVVDKVTRALSVTKQAKCAQAGLGSYTPDEVFGFCWSNQNAKLRTVPVDDSVTTGQSWETLLAAGVTLARTTVWQVDVKANVILSLTLASRA